MSILSKFLRSIATLQVMGLIVLALSLWLVRIRYEGGRLQNVLEKKRDQVAEQALYERGKRTELIVESIYKIMRYSVRHDLGLVEPNLADGNLSYIKVDSLPERLR